MRCGNVGEEYSQRKWIHVNERKKCIELRKCLLLLTLVFLFLQDLIAKNTKPHGLMK